VEGDVRPKRYKTQRGFTKIEFDDDYGERCSIQESSSAVSHVWIGLEEAKPKYLGSNGWTEYAIPPHVHINTRMHINKRQAKQLIKRLQKWVDTGEL